MFGSATPAPRLSSGRSLVFDSAPFMPRAPARKAGVAEPEPTGGMKVESAEGRMRMALSAAIFGLKPDMLGSRE